MLSKNGITARLLFCLTIPKSFHKIRTTLNKYITIEFFLFFTKISRSSKTFKPKKNIPEGTHQYDLMKHAAATLGSGNLRNAVALPDGEDLNEWVAVNSKLTIHMHYIQK